MPHGSSGGHLEERDVPNLSGGEPASAGKRREVAAALGLAMGVGVVGDGGEEFVEAAAPGAEIDTAQLDAKW